jgi:hypothetical protein
MAPLYETFYQERVPAEISIGSLVTFGSSYDWPAAVMSLGLAQRQACGGVAFTIGDVTKEKLRTEGLQSLGSASVGRSYVGKSDAWRYTYKPWGETPVPSQWFGDGKRWGLHCMDRRFADAIYAESKRPGSFFTEGVQGDPEILILPRLNLIVFTYPR